MEKNKNIPKLILYIFLTVILSLALPLSAFLIPLIALTITALFVATALNWHYVCSLFSAAFSGLALYLLFRSPAIAVALPAIMLVSAAGTYIALKLKATQKTVILAGTAGGFLLIILLVALLGSNFIAEIVNMAKTAYLDSLEGIIVSMPMDFSGADLQYLKQLYEEVFEGFKVIAPSILLSLIFLTSYFTLLISRQFAKGHPCFAGIPAFSEIHARPVFLAVTVIAYFGQTASNTFISGLMANLFMILSVFYTVCGLSLFDFFLKRKIKSLFGRIGIILATGLVLTVISMFILFANPVLITMFLGFADSFFNYRLRMAMFKK